MDWMSPELSMLAPRPARQPHPGQRALALFVPLPPDLRPAQKPSDRLVQPQPSEVKLLQEQAEHLGTEGARMLAEVLATLQLGQTLVGLISPPLRRGDC